MTNFYGLDRLILSFLKDFAFGSGFVLLQTGFIKEVLWARVFFQISEAP